MSDSSITKGQRHVSFPAQPEISGDPLPPDPLAPLDMILRFSEGRQFHVHLAKEPCSALVRELLTALTALCDFGGTLNSPSRAEMYTLSIRKFVRFWAMQAVFLGGLSVIISVLIPMLGVVFGVGCASHLVAPMRLGAVFGGCTPEPLTRA